MEPRREVLRAYCSGDFYMAQVALEMGVKNGQLSPAAAEKLRAAEPKWRAAYAQVEELMVRCLQTMARPVAFRELRGQANRFKKQPYVQQVLLYQLRERFDFWVKEAARRPKLEEEPDSSGLAQEDDFGPAAPTVDPQVSEGNEEIFGAAAYLSLERDILELLSQRSYEKALVVLREQLPIAGSRAGALQRLLTKVEDAASADLKAILARLERLGEQGRYEEALALARQEFKNFPRRGRLAKVHHAAEYYERKIASRKAAEAKARIAKRTDKSEADGGAPESVTVRPGTSRPGSLPPGVSQPGVLQPGISKPGLETSESRVAAAILANEERRYADAAALFEGLAALFESSSPRLYGLYRTEADEARFLGFAKDSLQRALSKPSLAAKLLRVPAGLGRSGKLVGADKNELQFETEQGPVAVRWKTLSDTEITQLFEISVTTPLERLGLAVLYFRLGRKADAEKQLRIALRSDRSLKPLLDRILAKARSEALPEGGYVLEKGAFIPYPEKLRRQLEGLVHREVAKALRQPEGKLRNKVLTAVFERGPIAVQLAREDLIAKRKQLLAEIAKAPVKSSLKKLQKLRRELDKRRKHALDLIYDTKKYFYPYKPPAVSGEKAKEYAEVQAEVDRRCAAVQDIWDGKGISVTVSGTLKKRLALLDWVQRTLRELGVDLGKASDADLLVKSRGLSIRNVALDARDQRYMEYWQEVDEYNKKKLQEWVRDNKISREQVALVQYTNAYREMMGRHPLKVDLRVMKAAQGHCEEMATLGYFSHYSPTQGRRTPQERMRLEGYPNPGGENLAIDSGALSSVHAWRRSSGHHRNMLSKGHGDLGTGASGRYYAQNFGGGNGRWR
ncbi:MAG: hypothetical protein CSA62_04410 [Planctomycetota bacterium]|nr:MAG: hypothetical protein CSA62_04410 [Planctomycetota bacterium]